MTFSADVPILIEATERSPKVEFDLQVGRFRLSGESYPEDAGAFFGPLLQALREYFEAKALEQETWFELDLQYFNSSSAKALMNFFQVLEGAAEDGHCVHIRWHYEREDETMQEFGGDFAEDFEHADYQLCEK